MNDVSNTVETAEEPHPPFRTLRTYKPNLQGFEIVIAQGSVLDFAHKNGAIVNAANEGCLRGGGVDGAISAAGGEKLFKDRLALPVIASAPTEAADMSIEDEDKMSDDVIDEESAIRCLTGSAVLTGPGDYGKLKVPYVIHAVGPNFWIHGPRNGQTMLVSAYQTSLEVAAKTDRITDVAFSLLSAGIFRGRIKLSAILKVSMHAISNWKYDGESKLERVYLFGFTDHECHLLVTVGDHLFGRPVSEDESTDDVTGNDKNEKTADADDKVTNEGETDTGSTQQTSAEKDG